jgi:hypothetical protein
MLTKQRKAQIRLTETIAVLFIFFVLIIFGIFFYSKYQTGAIKEKEQDLFERRVIETTTKALFLPELLCTNAEAEIEDFCFDLLKLEHVQGTLENRDYYFNIFSFATITVEEIYPLDSERSWTIYQRENPQNSGIEQTNFIVALKDEGANTYSLGKVTVGVYR